MVVKLSKKKTDNHKNGVKFKVLIRVIFTNCLYQFEDTVRHSIFLNVFLAKSVPYGIKRFLKLLDIFKPPPLSVNTFNCHSLNILGNIEVYTYGQLGQNLSNIVSKPFFNFLSGMYRRPVLLIYPLFSTIIGSVQEKFCFQLLYTIFVILSTFDEN